MDWPVRRNLRRLLLQHRQYRRPRRGRLAGYSGIRGHVGPHRRRHVSAVRQRRTVHGRRRAQRAWRQLQPVDLSRPCLDPVRRAVHKAGRFCAKSRSQIQQRNVAVGSRFTEGSKELMRRSKTGMIVRSSCGHHQCVWHKQCDLSDWSGNVTPRDHAGHQRFETAPTLQYRRLPAEPATTSPLFLSVLPCQDNRSVTASIPCETRSASIPLRRCGRNHVQYPR